MMEDKRLVYIDFFGVNFPLCLTVLAQEKIAEDYGSTTKLLEALDDEENSFDDGLTHWINLLHYLMEGGVARVKMLAFLHGEEASAPVVPTVDQLKEIIGWSEVRAYTTAIFGAMGVSTAQTVEAEPQKNAETTQE